MILKIRALHQYEDKNESMSDEDDYSENKQEFVIKYICDKKIKRK